MSRLKELIQRTHVHGLRIQAELLKLNPKGLKARLLKAQLRGLVALNKRRWKELHQLEHPRPPARFTMYDTTNPASPLPVQHPAAVAGYVGGHWPSYNGLVARYPAAKHLSIAVNSGENATCLDVETGDASPSEAPAWFRRQKVRGVSKPVFYANASTMPAVHQALLSAGIQRWEYREWVAHYTGTAHVEGGADACQYASVETAGRNFDASLCEGWFL